MQTNYGWINRIRALLSEYPAYIVWIVSRHRFLFALIFGILLMFSVLFIKVWYATTYVRGKTNVVVSITDLFTTVHPLVISDRTLDQLFKELVYAPLLYVDSAGNIQEVLISGFSVDDNNRVYTLTLKEDIYWDNGARITANDVVFTYKFIRTYFPDSQVSKALSGANITPLGDRVVEFRLKNPYVGFMRLLEYPIGSSKLYSGADIYGLLSSAYTKNIISSGAYRLKYLGIDRFVLEPRIESNHLNNRTAKTNITFLYQKSPRDVYYDLTAQKADVGVFTVIDNDILKKVQYQSQMRLVKYPITNNIKGLFFNLKANSLFSKEKNLRKTLYYLLSPQLFIQKFGLTPAYSIYPEGSSYFLPVLTSRSVEQGSELLDDYKQKNITLHFTLAFLDLPEERQMALYIRDYLKNYNIQVRLDAINPEDFDFKVFEQKDFEILLYGITVPTDPDQSVFWHSKGALNIVNLSNSELDSLLEKGLVSYNLLDRQIIYNKVQDILILQEVVFIPLYHPNLYVVYKENLVNLGFNLEPEPIIRKADFVRIAFPYMKDYYK